VDLSPEPMLEPAPPGDAPSMAAVIPSDSKVEVRLKDGTWISADVRGQRRGVSGRWQGQLAMECRPGRERVLGVVRVDGDHIRRQRVSNPRRRGGPTGVTSGEHSLAGAGGPRAATA
jgi:hypothetical protein